MDPLVNLQDSRLLHFQYIFNLIQQYGMQVRFFDIRTTHLFQSSHLRISHHIPAESVTLESDLLQFTHERTLSRLRRYCIIIAYSEEFESLAYHFKASLAELKCRELHLLPNIEQFICRYRFLCSDFPGTHLQDFPNEIIPRILYLGSQEHAHNRNVIEVLEITHVLNVTRGAANLFPGLKYCRVHVDDCATENIALYFQKAFVFIQEAMEENRRGAKNIILVHCARGISRSATIVLMYLMRSAGLTLEESLKFLKRNREIAEPNEGFMKALRDFENNQHQFARSLTTSKFTNSLDEEINMDNMSISSEKSF